MNEIYVFLDWSMTISNLIKNNKLNASNFKLFFNALKKLEQKTLCHVNFVVVSGCSKNNALTRFNILQNAFKSVNRLDMFKGVAYEYGAYYLDENNKVFTPNTQYKLKNLKAITNFVEKNNYKCSPNFKVYVNVETFNGDNLFLDFVNKCKNEFKNLSFVYYNDNEGVGLDIKNKELTKGKFITWFLQNKQPPKLIIVGGDDAEDTKMLVGYNQAPIVFVGFSGTNKIENKNMFLSEKKNVLGIVDSINKLIKLK